LLPMLPLRDPGATTANRSGASAEFPALTTNEVGSDAICTGLLLSVTVAVKFEVPLSDGVPLMMPLEGDSVNPAGSWPPVMDH